MALDTVVHVLGPGGTRRVPLTEFYLQPGDTPHIENVLAHGELITEIEIPLLPGNARSAYLKVRDRASYEFALTSAGGGRGRRGRGDPRRADRPGRRGHGPVARVGGRARAARRARHWRGLPGGGARPRVRDPFTVPGTAFKVELAKRTLVRVLRTVTGVTS